MPVPTNGSIGILFVAAAIAFAITATLVIVSRLRYDRRHRFLRRLETLLGAAGGTGAARDNRERALDIVTGAPTSWLKRLAAEETTSPESEKLIASALEARLGIAGLRRDALRPGRGWQQWRRIAALRVLALVRPDQAWDCFERALGDGGREVTAATVTILERLADRRAATLLIEALQNGRHSRSRIATSVDVFPLHIGDLVLQLLQAADPQVQYWGALLMRRYPATPALEPRLARLTESQSALVRKAAIETLGGIQATGAVEALRTRLSDPVPFVRAHAARALGVLHAEAVAEDVLPLLADRDWWVRTAAKQCLQTIGPGGARAALSYLSHRDPFARNGAAEVLQNLGVFEHLLAEEAVGPSDPRRLSTLQLLARAGGVRMWATVVGRLSAAAQARAKLVLSATALGSTGVQEVSQ